MADLVNDATLLDRFVNGGEEAAFAALVSRHVARVRSACRGVLRSEHDAEDVVQATFLVLALKAAEMTWRDSVGGWLCAVARRLSLDARAGACRRSRRETPLSAFSGKGSWGGGTLPEGLHPLADPLAELERTDVRRVIDDELGRLPEKYRVPVVLCDLEGLTHAEAARRLGVPAGSMSRRLTRARAILRHRLVVRGLPAAVLLLGALAVGLWETTGRRHRVAGEGSPVRAAMAPFRGLDLEPVLSRMVAGDSDELRTVARRAATVADRVAGIEPGRDRPTWRFYTSELRLSAAEMDEAARTGDAVALLAATNRANESCVRCHLAFRE